VVEVTKITETARRGAHACNPSSGEVEAGGSQVPGLPGPHGEMREGKRNKREAGMPQQF
jgi:hypothetical protein